MSLSDSLGKPVKEVDTLCGPTADCGAGEFVGSNHSFVATSFCVTLLSMFRNITVLVCCVLMKILFSVLYLELLYTLCVGIVLNGLTEYSPSENAFA